jgi:hypothetical protein
MAGQPSDLYARPPAIEFLLLSSAQAREQMQAEFGLAQGSAGNHH